MQEFIARPFLQIVFFTLLSMVVVPAARPKNADSVFTIVGVIYMVFILVNSVAICFAPKVWPYFFNSLLFSIVFLLTLVLLASIYIDVTKTQGSGETAMVFLVVMYHPIALLLVIFLQWAYLRLFQS
jgi:hypothetical protein